MTLIALVATPVLALRRVLALARIICDLSADGRIRIPIRHAVREPFRSSQLHDLLRELQVAWCISWQLRNTSFAAAQARNGLPQIKPKLTSGEHPLQRAARLWPTGWSNSAEGPAPDRALEIKHLQSGDKIEAMQSGSSDLRTPVPARHLAFLETRGREFGYL